MGFVTLQTKNQTQRFEVDDNEMLKIMRNLANPTEFGVKERGGHKSKAHYCCGKVFYGKRSWAWHKQWHRRKGIPL